MSMWGLSLLLAFGFAGGGLILDLFSSKGEAPHSKLKKYGQAHHWHYTSTVLATVITFVVVLFYNYLNFYNSTPSFSGAGWVGIVVVNAIFTLVIFGIANGASKRISLAPIVALLTVIGLGIGYVGIYNNWTPGNHRITMGHVLKVQEPNTNDSAMQSYPDTLDQNIVEVSDGAALYKAKQALGIFVPHTDIPLGTAFALNQCVLKAVNGNMFYICSLKPNGTVNNREFQGRIPGYIVVDAQNPTPNAWVHWVWMYYSVGGYGAHSVDRLIWNSGLGKRYTVDDLTLEVDNHWNPVLTASLDQSIFRMQQGVPTSLLTVNPVNGAIKQYPINNQPNWVTRTYSGGMASILANWWGKWGTVPWNVQGTVGRYQVDGGVNLVNTSEGTAWQVLLTSLNQNDPSIVYVGLESTTQPVMRLYRAPNGLTSQATVTHAIITSQNNLKSLVPASLTLYQINGVLYWVAPLEPQNDNNPATKEDPNSAPPAVTGEIDTSNTTPESTGGIALLKATDPNSDDVIVADNFDDAYAQAAAQVASGSGTTTPNAQAHTKTVTGVIAAAHTEPLTKNGSQEVIRLAGDINHLYVGQLTGTSFWNDQMGLASQGDTVTITYVDSGGPINSITMYTLIKSGVQSTVKPTVTAGSGR